MRQLPLFGMTVVLIICAVYQPNSILVLAAISSSAYLLYRSNNYQRIVFIVCLAGILCYYNYYARQLDRQARVPSRHMTVSGTCYPHEWTIDGNHFSGKLHTSSGEVFQCYWQIPTATIKEKWTQQTRPYEVCLTGECEPVPASRNIGSYDYRLALRCQGVTQMITVNECYYKQRN